MTHNKMRRTSSVFSNLLYRIAPAAIALIVVLMGPINLRAQAAGSAGTPGGQGDASTQKPKPKRTPQEVEEAVRKRRGNFKKSPKIKNTNHKDDPEIAALIAALEELKAGRSRDRNKPKGTSGENSGATDSSPAGGNPTGSNPTAGAGSGKNSGSGSSNPAATAGAGKPSAGGTSTGASNPPGTPGGATPGTPGGGTPGTGAGNSRPMGTATMVAARAPVAVTPPATPPSSPPNSGSASNRMTALAVKPNVSNVLGCSTGVVMIQNVNGVPTGVTNPKIVFTQDPQYNDYKISGCNFGQSQGQAHLNGPFRAGVVPLQIKSWTDTAVELMLDPNLKGEPDQSSVTLVINPVGKSQAQLQNCKFYAMRQEVTLTHFPQTAVTLTSIVDDAGAAVTTVKYSSPYTGGTDLSQKVEGTFAGGVDRFNDTRFNPQGTDAWDLSGLAPGFVPTQFSLGHWDGSCASGGGGGVLVDDSTLYTDGKWGAQWDPGNPRRVIVNLGEWHCHTTYSGDTSNSSYALEIQVSGPVGVNPWP